MTAHIVVDLGFGDSGKGTIVDFLARRSEHPPIVVRFNGGAQAAHNVITPTGTHHTFAQFGSGSFVHAYTFLSRFMLVDPITLANEAQHLQDIGGGNVYEGLYVDEAAKVVTPYHKAVNRAREVLRGDGRHGSCGMGIGEAMALHESDLTMYVRDLQDFTTIRQKLSRLRDWQVEQYQQLIRYQIPSEEYMNFLAENRYPTGDIITNTEFMYRTAQRFNIVFGNWLETLRKTKRAHLIFEGSQGVLLDEWYGFHPHTTWSTCTFENALTLLDEIGHTEEVTKLGVLRSYMVRHGPGPFPTEDPLLEIPERHNALGEWQGAFRKGWFDSVLARYAIDVCGGIDQLAITHLDVKPNLPIQIATDYRYPDSSAALYKLVPVTKPNLYAQEGLGIFLGMVTPEYQTVKTMPELADVIRQALSVRSGIHSYGPTAIDKEMVL
jgi:adenylosuccinate synthase